ncbi:MAG: SDR family NAD(P)-dependent oxidoreductase [Leptospiraceae bacterium]|nr:SDR family NAD(P)-dependent oxidoreductase [Leptospiraceae bacterium]MCP5497824.1 SDR family NAD(P)-dependent oxidoreductase [Leptospiraceae bacterium]
MARILILGATSTVATDIARIFASTALHTGASESNSNQLYIVGRNQEKLAKICREIAGNVVGFQSVDFNETDNAEKIILGAAEKLKGIDLALIAHGDLGDQLKSEVSYSSALDIFQVNCLSVIALLIPLANLMEKQGYGKIAVIGSVAGDRGRPRNYTYGAAKGAIRLYLQGIRSRLWRSGVAVHYLKLGPVDTPMTRNHTKNFSFTSSQKAAQGIVKAIEQNKEEAYIPKFWWFVMFLVRTMPEFIFQKLKFLSGR